MSSELRVRDVLTTEGLGGYYFDDLAAIRAGAPQDGFFYLGPPLTPGHRRIRQPGECISIVLVLEDGQVAHGDAVAIQYSGVVGRDPILIAEQYVPVVREVVAPLLAGARLTNLRAMCAPIEDAHYGGRRLHTGIRFGASQAILDALSKARRKTMAEIVAEECGGAVRTTPVPVLAQSGADRYIGPDKMILKRVPVMPQGLFTSVAEVGSHGERLIEYVKWLGSRIKEFGDVDYAPALHLDVYGTVGAIWNNDISKITPYLIELERAASPFAVYVEAPVDSGSRDSVIELMAELRSALASNDSLVRLVADDWCNTLEDIRLFVDNEAADMVQIKAPDLGSIINSIDAVVYCRDKGIAAFLGGTCNGTDQSARVTVHVAMGADADLIYNNPGMGVDEGLMIVTNEMARILLLAGRDRGPADAEAEGPLGVPVEVPAAGSQRKSV